MSSLGSLSYSHDAVRVRVKKCISSQQSDYRKFSIDPQITSFDVLHSIIAKAFEIKGNFSLSYQAIDDYGQDTFLPLLSDWDLDAAFLNASDPCLSINIDAKTSDDRSWSIEDSQFNQIAKEPYGSNEVPRHHKGVSKKQTQQNRLPGLIMNTVERTLNSFQRAFNMGEEVIAPPVMPVRPPLTDVEFRKYLDPIGQISQMKELRSAIYFGGIEPGLRKVVWKHILNVYPQGMSGKERIDYIKRKTHEYETLRETWRNCLLQGIVREELSFVTTMVRKDVLRTDRHHKFYAGSDDNQNIASLFNILTTYALNHPSVSYCQGMSDLASPLLVTMGDEAHAYICFCSLMTRLKPNFMLDGKIMTLKFQHLSDGLFHCDPQFHNYLKMHQAEDLLFCYRWLLLEMKREFAFEDALHMLEVLWSSLESLPPDKELPLFEEMFNPQVVTSPPPISPLVHTVRENPYTKVCALRRQSSSVSLNASTSGKLMKNHRQNQSLDESVLSRQRRFRKQGHSKPFFSLDDNCVEMIDGHVKNSHSTPAVGAVDSLTLLKRRVNSIKLLHKQNVHSVSAGNLIEAERTVDENSSGSLNKLMSGKENENGSNVHKGRTVKNLNEFWSLGRGRNLRPKQRSQCSSISESDVLDGPSIMITRSLGGMENEAESDVGSDISSLKQASSPSLSSSVSPNVFDPPHSEDSSPDLEPETERRTDSSPDDSGEYVPVTISLTRELRLDLDNLERHVLGLPVPKTEPIVETDALIWENPLEQPPTPDEQIELELDEMEPTKRRENENGLTHSEEVAQVPNFLARSAITTSSIIQSFRTGQLLRSQTRAFSSLPPPEEFGGGNPFLMFLCLTLLRQHRDYIISNQMDYNEMAIHFNKMVRKHNVTRVLDEARHMFATYLKQQSLQTVQSGKQTFKV